MILLSLAVIFLLVDTALLGYVLHRVLKWSPSKDTLQIPPAPSVPSFPEYRDHQFTPIVHPPVERERRPVIESYGGKNNLTYWQQRGNPEAEPVIAIYFKDRGQFSDTVVAAKHYYILDTKEVVLGTLFEREYEIAKVSLSLKDAPLPEHQFNSSLRMHNLLSSNRGEPELSEEEQKKLAEEYELGHFPKLSEEEHKQMAEAVKSAELARTSVDRDPV